MMFSFVLAAALTAETSRPNCSFYEFGAPVEATFKADGLGPGEKRKMSIVVVDEHENTLKTFDEEIAAGADGKWSKTLPMPAERMGFYRVRAKAEGGLSLPKTGSRPAGCITYAVMPDPAKRVAPLEEDSFMGNMGENSGDARVARWIGSRFEFGADTPSATPEGAAKRRAAREKALAETGYVRYGGATVAHHDLSKLKPFFSEEGRKWLEAQPFRKSSNLTWKMMETEEGERHYRDAVAAFTRAARAQLPPGRKRLLMEFFSEPDLTAPSAEAIVKAAKAVWEAVQSVDKDALVAQPGISTITAQGFHQKLFDLGIGRYMNAFHVHPYTAYPPEPNGYLQNVRNIKRMVREGVGRDVPLFALEAGFPIAATKEGELLQMNGEVRCLLMLLGEGFLYNYVFYSSDYGNDAGDNAEGDYGITYNLKLKTKRFGTDCVSPRPVMPALAAFSWLLDGYRPVSCIDYLGDTVLGYAYRNRKGACALALWDFEGGRTVEIPVGRDKVRVADVFANETVVRTEGGILKLEVGPSPKYVLDVDQAIWGGGGQVVRPDEGGRNAVAGDNLEVRGVVAEAGTLEVRPAAATGLAPRTLKVAKGGFSTTFPLPETTPDGEYPVMLAFRGTDGRLKSVTGYRVTVSAPVRIGMPEPSFAGGVPGVAFTAENLTDVARKVVFETRVRGVPEVRRRVAVTLSPHESRRTEMAFDGWDPNPFSLFRVEVAAESGQMRSERRKELNFLRAKRVPGAGRNGDFSAWKPDLRAVPEKIIANERLYSGPDDVSVKAACGWNDEYLLFAFDVQDDAFVQNRQGWLTWWGDSIQLALAKDVLEKTTANAATDLLLQAMTETTFALTSKGPEVYRTKTFDDKRFPSGTHGEGQIPLSECPFAVATEPNAKGALTRYRMAVPWRFLRIDRPEPGRSVYFAASANDVDEDAKSCMMFGIFELKQAAPKRFGRIVLAR